MNEYKGAIVNQVSEKKNDFFFYKIFNGESETKNIYIYMNLNEKSTYYKPTKD